MKTMKSRMIGALGGTLAAMAFGSAGAATLTLSPQSTDVRVGDTVRVDLVVGELGDGVSPTLAGFEATVGFAGGLLSLEDVMFGSALDPLGFGSVQDVDTGTMGQVDLAELSLDLPEDLDAAQGSSFTLATLTFEAQMQGSASLTILEALLSDPGFQAISVTDVFGATINVDAVPLPGAAVFLLTGLAGLAARKRFA